MREEIGGPGWSNGQALATLPTATVDDGPASFGPHPDQEAMGLTASPVIGLESPFHCGSSTLIPS